MSDYRYPMMMMMMMITYFAHSTRLTDLRFTDDIFSLAETADELQNMKYELYLAPTNIGLSLHITKTKSNQIKFKNQIKIPPRTASW